MNKAGNLESHMCLLNDQEETIDVVSLHKFKSERVYKAGRIVNIHSATLKEIEKHQALILKNNRGLMKDREKRQIIVFRPEPKWNILWPKDAIINQMAYKGTGFIDRSLLA